MFLPRVPLGAQDPGVAPCSLSGVLPRQGAPNKMRGNLPLKELGLLPPLKVPCLEARVQDASIA